MKTHIEIDIDDGWMSIREPNCTGCFYDISKNEEELVDSICNHLHDYLHGNTEKTGRDNIFANLNETMLRSWYSDELVDNIRDHLCDYLDGEG